MWNWIFSPLGLRQGASIIVVYIHNQHIDQRSTGESMYWLVTITCLDLGLLSSFNMCVLVSSFFYHFVFAPGCVNVTYMNTSQLIGF